MGMLGPRSGRTSRESGETGRRAGLRIQWAKALGGSTPPSRTKQLKHLRRTPAALRRFGTAVVPRIVPRHRSGAAAERCLSPHERRAHVVVGDDAVALEDADRLVPRHAHRHALIDAGRHEVADRRAPEVVEDERRPHDRLSLAIQDRTPSGVHLRASEPSRDARGFPGAAEVANRGAVPMKDAHRERRLAGPHRVRACLPAPRDDLAQLADERKGG